MLLAGGLSTIGGAFRFLVAVAGADPSLTPVAAYAAAGGTWFVIQSWLLARRSRVATVAASSV